MGIKSKRVHCAFVGTFILGGLLAYLVGRDQAIGMALVAAGLAYILRASLVSPRNRLAFWLAVIIIVAVGGLVSLAAFHDPTAAAYSLGVLAGWFIRDLVIGDEPPAPAVKPTFGLYALKDLQRRIRPFTKEAVSAVMETVQYLGHEVTVGQEIDAEERANTKHISQSQDAIEVLELGIQSHLGIIDANHARNGELEQLKALQPDSPKEARR